MRGVLDKALKPINMPIGSKRHAWCAYQSENKGTLSTILHHHLPLPPAGPMITCIIIW